MRKLALQPATEQLDLLVLGAHADDIEIGCGGTILRFADEGLLRSVRWIVFSAIGPRGEEARQSAARFLTGVRDPHIEVHAHRDGFFPYEGGAIKERFEALKTQLEPDLILTHARIDRHQDHRLLSELTWNTFRDHLILEYEVPKYDGDLGRPNVFVELPEPIHTRKTKLITEGFPSQAHRPWFADDTFRSLMRLRGMEANAASRHAEGFYAYKLLIQPAEGG
jgi:LmbE family N-acetylglucosaminyl deacetylase